MLHTNKNLLTVLLIICSLTTIPTYGMLSQCQHKPMMSPDDIFTTDMRTLLEIKTPTKNTSFSKSIRINLDVNTATKRIFTEYATVTVHDTATTDEQKHVCSYYAIKKITGSNAFLDCVPGEPEKTSLVVQKFFNQIKKPQNGDLVVYTEDEENLAINHYGVVIDNNIIESKWGKSKYILRHPLFAVPFYYGKAAFFFRLKKEYRGPSGNLLFHKRLILDQKQLLRTFYINYANKNNLTIIEDKLVKKIDKEIAAIELDYIKISNNKGLKW